MGQCSLQTQSPDPAHWDCKEVHSSTLTDLIDSKENMEKACGLYTQLHQKSTPGYVEKDESECHLDGVVPKDC